MDDVVVSTGYRIELIWQSIAKAFEKIPDEVVNLFNFAYEHEICWYILICFLISASVIIFKRLASIFGH